MFNVLDRTLRRSSLLEMFFEYLHTGNVQQIEILRRILYASGGITRTEQLGLAYDFGVMLREDDRLGRQIFVNLALLLGMELQRA